MPLGFTRRGYEAPAPHIRTDCSPHERSRLRRGFVVPRAIWPVEALAETGDMRGNPECRLRLIRATERAARSVPFATRAAFVPAEICYSMLSARGKVPAARFGRTGRDRCDRLSHLRKLHETHSKGCVPGCRPGDAISACNQGGAQGNAARGGPAADPARGR